MPAPKEESIRLVVRKIIPASPEEVFAAWTDPESIRQWMCPGDIDETVATLDLRVGGTYRILMKGKTQNYDHTGVYKVIERPTRLAFTWVSAGTDQQETLVTVEFHQRPEGTELVLTHEKFPTVQARDRHQGGWSQIADKLAVHFASA